MDYGGKFGKHCSCPLRRGNYPKLEKEFEDIINSYSNATLDTQNGK